MDISELEDEILFLTKHFQFQKIKTFPNPVPVFSICYGIEPNPFFFSSNIQSTDLLVFFPPRGDSILIRGVCSLSFSLHLCISFIISGRLFISTQLSFHFKKMNVQNIATLHEEMCDETVKG